MKNILLLTDFSELSGYARSLADKVANTLGSKLHLVKIVDIPSEIQINKKRELIGGMSNNLSVFTEEKMESEKQMKEWSSQLESNFTTDVMYGRLLDTVKEYIRDNEIDLLILGTHETHGLREFLSGTLTEQLIKSHLTPVLSIKRDREGIDFSDFLITGDFENKPFPDLELLKVLQKTFGTKVHLLWVNTKNSTLSREDSIARMSLFAQVNGLENVMYHHHVDESIELGIVNFSNSYDESHELDIDIIAVEKKDKTQLGYVLTGCQSTSFVNHIPRPILTYRNNKK